MNYKNFEKWLTESLTPLSVLVMDNAPYHGVQIDPAPTLDAKKSTITYLGQIKKNYTCRRHA
jgi:predicted O-methyltransferase YrrM